MVEIAGRSVAIIMGIWVFAGSAGATPAQAPAILDVWGNGIEFRSIRAVRAFDTTYDYDFSRSAKAEDLFAWGADHGMRVEKSSGRYLLTNLGAVPAACRNGCEGFYLTDLKKTHLSDRGPMKTALIRYFVIVKDGNVILIEDASAFVGP